MACFCRAGQPLSSPLSGYSSRASCELAQLLTHKRHAVRERRSLMDFLAKPNIVPFDILRTEFAATVG